MNIHNCTLCKKKSGNKLILVNGTKGKKKKLIVTVQTESGEIKTEFDTDVEIKYCVSCGDLLPRLFPLEETTENNKKNKECKYCHTRKALLSNFGKKSIYDEEVDGKELKAYRIVIDTNNCWETDVFRIVYEMKVNNSCLIENTIWIAPDYCPVCGRKLEEKENRLFTQYHIPEQNY